MPNMKHDAAKQLEFIADLVAEEVLALSDTEILDGACSEHPESDANRAREIYQKAAGAIGQRRLAAARARVQASRSTANVPAWLRSPDRAREYINTLINTSPLMKQKMTLAARSGSSLSDSDIQLLIDDLAALGDLPDLTNDRS